MIYRRTPTFNKAYKALPHNIQLKVKKAFNLFQQNPNHPSLGVKKIKGREDLWEGRIDQFYRFTFEYVRQPETNERVCLFRNIGRHEIIDHEP